MIVNGRPTHIEDYLRTLYPYSWYKWSDSKNKIYANLVLISEKIWNSDATELIDNPVNKLPTEKQCIDGLKALQDAWDLENDSYRSQRRAAYPDLETQLDQQYWDSVNGTTTWKDGIAKIKSDYPKPS
tara:strand:+ start:82 stop:465 length:384 start_codon:yes stop_codon:yes gene_type:complete